MTGTIVSAVQLRQAKSLEGLTLPNGQTYDGELDFPPEETDTGSASEYGEINYAWRDLRGRDFQAANLANANLRGAILAGVNLSDANLNGANLYGAHLGEAILKRADLRGADLLAANLHNADLSQADLQSALVTEKQLGTTLSLEGAVLPDGSTRR